MKTLFLHAGAHKTGTSSLQVNLGHLSGALEDLGIRYLTDWDADFTFPHQRYFSTGNANPLAYAMRAFCEGEEADALDPHLVYESLFARLEGKDIAILSHEDLINAPERFLCHFAAACERAGWLVRPVIFVRDQMSWHVSNYGQYVRQLRFTGEFEPLVIRSLVQIDWHSKIQNFETAFKSENIMVRPFDRNRVGDRIVRYFMSSIGLELGDIDLLEECKVNIGLSLEEAFLLAALNRMEADSLTFSYFNQYLISHSPSERRDIIPPSTQKIIKEYYKIGNEKMFAKYFSEGDRDIFEHSMDHFESIEDISKPALERLIQITAELVVKTSTENA